MDEFERLLQRQPLRDVPTEWKTEILTAQRTAGRGKNAAPANGVAWWHWRSNGKSWRDCWRNPWSQ